ncbi:patatin family protein, partial [Acinetobacter baumannii]
RSSNPEQQILEVCPPPLKNMAGRLTTNPKKLRYSYEVGLETGLQAIENWNAMK